MNKFDEISRLMSASHQLYDKWARKKGINYNILAVFYSIIHYPNCTQKDISEHWGLAKQTVFSVCQQLAKQELLAFFTDDEDKRSKVLYLTDKGKAIAQPIIDEIYTIEMSVIKQFGEQEMAELVLNLQKLSGIIEQQIEV
ncbi:MarR family transcriptional regulator [Mannheimia sp. AT1]|uniref:MarR family transcriptional regulator n=1 Tax=Mannheimia cairinae TaxID=3025936 RepID=A0ABT5MRP6_9PAST|nr:MarR family transcriptional regulator [Mannheimia cairinae]MDD0824720.1 MarR family transcriptional regulator [Mannheimia cairinae]MDD0826351.1 MarR family transcriptional regulator [Mannheimia cairinae]